MRSPKFSIIMPTYHREHTIFRTIETIREQSYPHWELIVVDNAGDGGYQFKDHRIQVHCHTEQADEGYARNQGIVYATGDLVCFFDDDDEMFPHYLESFANAFVAHPQTKMVKCGMMLNKGQIDYSYATPECCLPREFATPTWPVGVFMPDQQYFQRIVATNGWSEADGSIVVIREVLCRAHADPQGGQRARHMY